MAGRVLVAVTGIGTDPPGPGQVVEARRGGQNVVATGASFLTDADSRGGNDLSYLVGAPTNTLVQRAANGRTSTVDIGAFEAANNPDQGSTYGLLTQLNVSQACQATIPPDLAQVLAQYQGVVDSDAFRMLQLPGGSTLVADAAGNDVLRVAANGAISVVAVLPPNPTHLDKAFVAQATDDAGDTFPPCFIDAVPASGIDIAFEPVPTGLALGPDGNLYVGELPGGELPGSGRVVRVNMNTGAVEPFAGGLSDVTDIAFGKNGALYTTELFAPAPGSDPSSPDFVPGTLAKFPTSKVNGKLVAGNPSFLAAPLPNGLTVDQQGTLYASILSLTPAGMVVPVNF